MARHYSYRMDHDTGFAPCVAWGMCTLCGCKKARKKHGKKYGNIESWAKPGSWVVGIGGNNTGKPDDLIYAMKVDTTLCYRDFRRLNPRRSSYLHGRCGIKPTDQVLLSKQFYYFGDSAVPLPRRLLPIIVRTQGCRRIDDQIDKLEAFLKTKKRGIHGKPNNPYTQRAPCGGCH